MEIHAHKNILSVHSDFFKAMFSVGMIETQTQTATFNDICPDIMKALIDYMYTGRLKGKTRLDENGNGRIVECR